MLIISSTLDTRQPLLASAVLESPSWTRTESSSHSPRPVVLPLPLAPGFPDKAKVRMFYGMNQVIRGNKNVPNKEVDMRAVTQVSFFTAEFLRAVNTFASVCWVPPRRGFGKAVFPCI